MFGVDSTELFIVAVAALIFIGPKDLPKVMRVVGYWVGRARGMARHFTAGLETMMREAELEEMERKWSEENERIMRMYPSAEPIPDQPMLPIELSDRADPGQPTPPPSPEQPEEDKRPLP